MLIETPPKATAVRPQSVDQGGSEIHACENGPVIAEKAGDEEGNSTERKIDETAPGERAERADRTHNEGEDPQQEGEHSQKADQ